MRMRKNSIPSHIPAVKASGFLAAVIGADGGKTPLGNAIYDTAEAAEKGAQAKLDENKVNDMLAVFVVLVIGTLSILSALKVGLLPFEAVILGQAVLLRILPIIAVLTGVTLIIWSIWRRLRKEGQHQ